MPPSSVEGQIRTLAARQHGLVTRGQLLESGLGPGAVMHRLGAGLLHPLHSGVYRLGPLISPFEREMAAALACGPDAVVSHRSAAGLARLLPARAPTAPVEITLRSRRRRRRPGVRTYSAPALRADEVSTIHGIPVTSAARTLIDLARVVPPRRLEQALAVAEREGLATVEQVQALLARCGPRPGARRLRTLLASAAGPAFTRSHLEEHLLTLVRRHGLPRPELNVELCGYEVDALWRRERLVAELDGFRTHGNRVRFVSDRKRDRRLAIAGYRVARFTWAEIVDTPATVATELRTLLTVGVP